MIINSIISGNGGLTASIFVTGLSETDTVTATKDGKTYSGKWVSKPNPACVVPDGYTQLEYIESSGTQYINTGIRLESNYVIDMDVSINSGNSDRWLFGADNYSNNRYGVNSLNDTSIQAIFCASSWTSSTSITVGERFNIEYKLGSQQTCSKDGVVFGTKTNTINKSSLDLYIFSDNINNTATSPSKIKAYTFKCYSDLKKSMIIMNLVPCKRSSDNAIGMYDLVTNTFFGNSGTGTFVAGAEVPQTVDGFMIDDIKSYGTYTITATDGTNTATQDVLVDVFARYEIELSYVKVYGISWDKSSTTKFSRTDDAAFFTEPTAAIGTGAGSSPFDDCYPWSGIEKVTMNGDVLVKIPKFWVKVTNGAELEIQIAGKAKEGFNVSPAHADRGDGKGERDYIYVSRYTLNSSYKSTSGNTSVTGITRATARSQIKSRGIGYYQYDYLTYLTILYLYLVEYADWNAQNVIGYGYCASGNSAQINTGGTDSMTYHTGTAGSSRDANAAIQYRYIENLWGNIWYWVDGIYFSGTNIYVIKNPENFSDHANGTKLSFARSSATGYASDVGSDNTNPEYIYPTAVNGSETTYCSDGNWYDSSGVVLGVGGSWTVAGRCGVLSLAGDNPAHGSSSIFSARLIYLP